MSRTGGQRELLDPMRVFITGGSGHIGSAYPGLIADLDNGHYFA